MNLIQNDKPLNLNNLQLTPCRPPLWAGGGHRQTILGHLLPSPKSTLNPSEELVDLPDGDRLAVCVYPGQKPVTLYLFHGLGGCNGADYMTRSAAWAAKRGYAVWSVNHRGCGSGRGLAAKPYHSGIAEDLAHILKEGKKRNPNHRHICIGFSLSGNALLLLLSGRDGKGRKITVKPDLAVAVNAPIALEKAARNLKRGLNRVYDIRFVQRLRKAVAQRYRDDLINTNYRIPRRTTLHDFDNLYTAPEAGFRDREDYYARCSTKSLLREIRTPTIMLTAQDDPLVPVQDYLEAELSPWIHMHVEPNGGHMGYLHGDSQSLGTRRWLDYALDRFTAAWLSANP